MNKKKWLYDLGRLSFIFLLLAPGTALLAFFYFPSGDGWAQAYGPLAAALYLFAGFVILSFITGLLGIFHAERFQAFALTSVFITSGLILYAIFLALIS